MASIDTGTVIVTTDSSHYAIVSRVSASRIYGKIYTDGQVHSKNEIQLNNFMVDHKFILSDINTFRNKYPEYFI